MTWTKRTIGSVLRVRRFALIVAVAVACSVVCGFTFAAVVVATLH